MALTINYALDPAAVSATLERVVNKTFDFGVVADDVVDLVTSETMHVYSDGVAGTRYGFKVTQTDAEGGVTVSDPFHMVYLEDTGPGKNNQVTRGYFDFGVIDILTDEEFGSTTEALRVQLATTSLPNIAVGYSDTGKLGWYKCLVEGKVIFIPKNFYLYIPTYAGEQTKTHLLQNGLVSTRAEGGLDFNDCPIMTIRGRRYRWRGIKHWVGNPVDLDVPLKQTTAIGTYPDHYGRATEADLYYTLCNTTVQGYDPGLIGNVSKGQTRPPFVAGNNSCQFGVRPTSGMTLMGTSRWPEAHYGRCIANTPPIWVLGYSNPNYIKFVPVLELLD